VAAEKVMPGHEITDIHIHIHTPGVPGIDGILEGLARIPLSPEARAKIMGGNARRLFP
jgi:predicted TIM-barrel fold metal-dependent hydrolase